MSGVLLSSHVHEQRPRLAKVMAVEILELPAFGCPMFLDCNNESSQTQSCKLAITWYQYRIR